MSWIRGLQPLLLLLLLSGPVTAAAQAPSQQAALPVTPVSPCPPDWEAEICQLKAVVEVLRRSHITEIDMPAFLAETIRLGVRTLPYGMFRTADEQLERIAEQEKSRNGSPGLGVIIEPAGDLIRVIDLLPGGPAEKGGVRAGDRILSVDGLSLRGLPFGDVGKHTRGAAGTPVRLTVLRGVPERRVELTVIRQVVRFKSVSARRLAGGVLWTRLENFPETSVRDYMEMVQAERRQAPVTGVLLDLRRNGGGALNAAVGMTALFAGRDKTVMATVGRDPRNDRRYTTNWPDYELPADKGVDPLGQADDWWRTVPLIVLVDGQSASAGEATAAALKDLGRAKLLGLPTYGKGLAQTDMNVLLDANLTWTASRNLRPNGCGVEGWGVAPDWWVPPRRGADMATLMLMWRELDFVRPAYLDKSGPDPFESLRKERQRLRDERASGKRPKAQVNPLLPRKEFAGPADWQVRQALLALAGKPVGEPPATVGIEPQPPCPPLAQLPVNAGK